MVTSQEFKQAQTVVRCILEVVFSYQHEPDFKQDMLQHATGWDINDFTIERMHMSGYNFRVEVLHDDGRKREVYLKGEDVFEWYEHLGKKLLQENE
ncbi:hypothetical protein VPLG_00125 [Vibrio phage eugene 12A10]|uniref:hypothetical protein n=1 Tax=Vibrio phage eugene 12A10 TaxID=573172 RepID=UPI0003519FED|nr:hypothetical protein VPLG_00125 [Vibrio phage eugene 12A10]AGN51564.1 hypothetical protein VPLG_00125 [Vibrio phage eugene 12A10]